MSNIGKKERETQNRVVALFQKELKYRYLGNWEEGSMGAGLVALKTLRKSG
jgi:hypothetical protein